VPEFAPEACSWGESFGCRSTAVARRASSRVLLLARCAAISFAAHSASKRDLSAARLSGVSAVPPLQASSRRALAKGLA
jgi:hypothetical protein